MDLQHRIEQLEAVDAVLRLKHRYGELVDGLADRLSEESLQALGALFTEDAFVDFESVQLHGRAAVMAQYGGVMQQVIGWLWHSFHSPIIDVEGANARGRWTVQSIVINHAGPEPTTVYGRYDDRFVRTPEGWRISHMHLMQGPAGMMNELRRGWSGSWSTLDANLNG